MAKAIPNPDAGRPGANGSQGQAPANSGGGRRHFVADNWSTGNLLDAGSDDHQLLDLLQGAAETEELADPRELERLRTENAQLHQFVAELNDRLREAAKKNEPDWRQRQQEYESLLEEKSELIRSLHLRVQELEANQVEVPKEEELLLFSEELERGRCQLQQERRQLEEERRALAEDESSMSNQMRDMEVQMARERAHFARQRNELQRVFEEIRRELENIERNGLLNQRLSQLRQRYQDVADRKA
jgi:hypothetical protein